MDRDVDSEAETRVVKLSKGRLVKPKKSRRPWRAYTDREDETLLEHILKMRGKIMGNQVWMQLERKGVLPGRPWQSLRNHFIRIILPNIDLHVDPVIAQKIKVRAKTDCTSEEENECQDGSSSEEEKQVAPRKQDCPTKKGGRVLLKLNHKDPLHREIPERNLGRGRPATDSAPIVPTPTEPTSAQMSPPCTSKGPVQLFTSDSTDSDTALTVRSHAASWSSRALLQQDPLQRAVPVRRVSRKRRSQKNTRPHSTRTSPSSSPAKTPPAKAPRQYSALEQSPNVIVLSENEAESEEEGKAESEEEGKAEDISRDRQEPQRSHNVSEEEEELEVFVDPLYEEYYMKYDEPSIIVNGKKLSLGGLPFPVVHPSV